MSSRIRTEGGNKKRNIPEGLWGKCVECEAVLYQPESKKNGKVCPKCGHHESLSGRERLEYFLDDVPMEEIGGEVKPEDPLKFRDTKKYKDRIVATQKSTNENDALIAVKGQLKGREVVVTAFDFKFMAGSMGSVVGEKFVYPTDRTSFVMRLVRNFLIQQIEGHEDIRETSQLLFNLQNL